MDLRETLNVFRDTAGRWLDRLAYGVRAYRGWVLSGIVIFSILLIVWARFGFTLQFSQYYAASPEYVAESCWISGEHGCCLQAGQDESVCTGTGATINFGPTPNCTGGCYGNPQYCGPSVPAGGDFAWSLADTNVPGCGVKPNANTEYVVGVDVGHCHPDGLHLVWRAVHRPAANCSTTDGSGSVEIAEGDGIRTWYTDGSFIGNNDWQDLKPGSARMAYDGGAANCGSVHLFGAFWADPPPEAYKHNLAGNTGYHYVLDYGQNCTGAPGQFSPAGTPTTGGNPGTANGGTLSVTCGDTENVLTWDKGTGVQRGNEGTKNLSECADYWCWLPSQGFSHSREESGAYTYIDGDLQTDVCYEYRVKLGSDVNEHSNTVFCPSGCGEPGPSPSPTPTPTASPTPPPVVVTITPTPTGGGTPLPGADDLRMTGSIRNVSEQGAYADSTTARPNQEVQVRMVIDVLERTSNVIVGADVPDTVTYIAGSTTIDGTPTSLDAMPAGGLALGTLEGSHEVTFRMAVKAASALPEGSRSDPVALRADGDRAGTATDTVLLIVSNFPQAGAAAATPTGPGDVTVLALLAAALATLLYASYTHSRPYRTREASRLGKRHEPMDFQN